MGIGMPKICGEYMNEKNANEAARMRESGECQSGASKLTRE